MWRLLILVIIATDAQSSEIKSESSSFGALKELSSGEIISKGR